MINNLLVVLTSENNIQPVVNAGQYQDGWLRINTI
jgi:hypothetical protein